ncbi:BA14K family protein [Bartonella schoenbuchensis]|uniref:BA14K family protein n=1 Tax=Bartonella schoenbuchensis TaxID=165694 RepID=UPI001ABAE4FD|nr:BA14K family protein [Bartonella schoenbuchensis]
MNKLTKLIVLSAISTATISTPLTTASARNDYVYIQHNVNSIPQHHTQYHREQRHIHHKNPTRYSYHYEHTTQNHVHQYHVNRPNNTNDALAAGVLGLATGAILGNVLTKPAQPQIIYQAPYPQNQVIYQEIPQPQVVYQVHPPVTYHPAYQQPWTSQWLQYCTKKYRSFNPRTGTFRGYDGLDHFCHAPLQ